MTPVFELQKHEAMIIDFNPRREKIGDADVFAGDLKVQARMTLDDLAMFSPTLKAMIYDSSAPDVAGACTTLRYPLMGEIEWNNEMIGPDVSVSYGIDEELVLDEARVDRFRLAPLDGGVVIVSFRIRFHPTPRQAGLFATSLLREKVSLSVAPKILAEMKA